MKTLEEILQVYFNCKKPFDKKGQLTDNGHLAFKKLMDLLADLELLGIGIKSVQAASKLFCILDENY